MQSVSRLFAGIRRFTFQSRASLLCAGLALALPLAAREKSLTVSVRGQTAPDYQRVKLANGRFKAERYVLANGGKFPGTTRDDSVEKVPYSEVAGIVARHLAAQQYYLALKAKDADLLIAVYWGETIPFNDTNYDLYVDRLGNTLRMISDDRAQSIGERMSGPPGVANLQVLESLEWGLALIEMQNRARDEANVNNAKVIGYLDEINSRRDMLPWADVGDRQHDLLADVEESRYYIVVRAYDFKELQKTGKQVVRWATRISISSQGTGFDERVAQMVAAAGPSFGQKHGLKQRFYGDPRVDLGEVEYLGVATPKAPPSTPEKK